MFINTWSDDFERENHHAYDTKTGIQYVLSYPRIDQSDICAAAIENGDDDIQITDQFHVGLEIVAGRMGGVAEYNGHQAVVAWLQLCEIFGSSAAIRGLEEAEEVVSKYKQARIRHMQKTLATDGDLPY